MKKLLTIALIAMLALGSETVVAQGNSKGKGKAKGKPSFVDEKHRAHAEWKRGKDYAKAEKNYKKHHDDCCDHDDDRRRRGDDRWRKDDDRWAKGDGDRRIEDREREWKKKVEERRREEERRNDDRTFRDIILGRTGSN